MPDRPLTVLTYAASASLAAVALIYFFNPNYIIDGDGNPGQLSRRARINSVVALYNPANDCFINSILQALAGLGDLRIYLIRELHRRSLDVDKHVYKIASVNDGDGKPVDRRKLHSLLDAEVTRGLKEMLDRLNERPLQKKVISATPFIATLESAFATRVNRNQQDAQELLQVVAERMADEYAAGKDARRRSRDVANATADQIADGVVRVDGVVGAVDTGDQRIIQDQNERSGQGAEGEDGDHAQSTEATPTTLINGKFVENAEETPLDGVPEEEGFPLEGQTQSQIECQHCHFVPKSAPSSFIMLTLSVPHQKSSSSLNECFDGVFKTEYIDDYRCDRCRLQHAVSTLERQLLRAKALEQKERLQSDIDRLKKALETDPENPPEDIQLPDSKDAPTRRIARSVAITSFPRILVVHLSRSAYDPSSFSSKNTAKVVFPEKLPLGSLLDRRHYRLLGVVTHRGTHYSGHYETFRRQHIYPPSSTPHNDRQKGPYGSSAPTPQPSPKLTSVAEPRDLPITDPRLEVPDSDSEDEDRDEQEHVQQAPPSLIRHSLDSPSKPPNALQQPDSPSETLSPRGSTSTLPRESMSTIPTPSSVLRPDSSVRSHTPSSLDVREDSSRASGRTRTSSRQRVRNKIEEVKEQTKQQRRRKQAFRESRRWWRISDDKVKECKTSDVLGMQKEVYMLFYELEK